MRHVGGGLCLGGDADWGKAGSSKEKAGGTDLADGRGPVMLRVFAVRKNDECT